MNRKQINLLLKMKDNIEGAIESYGRLPRNAQHASASNIDVYAVICIVEELIKILVNEKEEKEEEHTNGKGE